MTIPKDVQADTIQKCTCGNETYNLKLRMEDRLLLWAECTECGRVARNVEDGISMWGLVNDD